MWSHVPICQRVVGKIRIRDEGDELPQSQWYMDICEHTVDDGILTDSELNNVIGNRSRSRSRSSTSEGEIEMVSTGSNEISQDNHENIERCI